MAMNAAEIQTLLSWVRSGDLHALAIVCERIDNGQIEIGAPGTSGASFADNPSARSSASSAGDITEPADLLAALIDGKIIPTGTWAPNDAAMVPVLLNSIRNGDRLSIGRMLALLARNGGRNGVVSSLVVKPTTIALSAIRIPEGTAPSTAIAMLTSDGNGLVTFTKISDPDAKFEVVGNELRLAASVDWETKTSHWVTVRAENAAGFHLQDFRIEVLNGPPVVEPGGGGGGGGGSSVAAPALPADTTFSIPIDYQNGAVVAYLNLTNVTTLAPTWTMTPAPGLQINAETGVVTIANAGLFHAALELDDVVFTIGAANSEGADACVITLQRDTTVYPTFTDIAPANRMHWMSSLHNDKLDIVTAGSKDYVAGWIDVDNPEYEARNDEFPRSYSPYWSGAARMPKKRPCLRFTTQSSQTQTGLFFVKGPWHPYRGFSVARNRIGMIPDIGWARVSNQGSPSTSNTGATADALPTYDPIGAYQFQRKPMVITVWHTADGLITVRQNGVVLRRFRSYGDGGTESANSNSGDYTPQAAGMLIFTGFITEGANDRAGVFGGLSIGNGSAWEENTTAGDMIEIIGWSNVNAIEA